MEIKTPLEELSQAFLCEGPDSLSDCWEQNILDDTKNEVLYIVPAGFSKRNQTQRERKVYYRAIYEKAVSLDAEKKRYPLGEDTHSVILQLDPQNRFDKHAIRIGVRFDDPNKTPQQWFKTQMWQDIGYVPQRISKLLHKNFHMLRHGTLISVHAMFDKDLYFARVAIPYGKSAIQSFAKCDTRRFNAILEE